MFGLHHGYLRHREEIAHARYNIADYARNPAYPDKPLICSEDGNTVQKGEFRRPRSCCPGTADHLWIRWFRSEIAFMSLKSLVFCSDEKSCESCGECWAIWTSSRSLRQFRRALRKLTRNGFEAIVVDFSDDGAFDVLRSARSAPCNKHAVAVAIVEPVVGLKAVFDIGAHFVLYKPV